MFLMLGRGENQRPLHMPRGTILLFYLYSFAQQLFVVFPLYSRHCSRLWVYIQSWNILCYFVCFGKMFPQENNNSCLLYWRKRWGEIRMVHPFEVSEVSCLKLILSYLLAMQICTQVFALYWLRTWNQTPPYSILI